MSPQFEITMRGYDIKEVDQLVAMVESKSASVTREDQIALLEALSSRKIKKFPQRFRGYSRIQVYNYIDSRMRELSRDIGLEQGP